jgi:Tc toxin complex TcA C-terminal TcB-binding domain
MEMAYHDLNQREYELTKHISLLQVDPLALLQLRTTGRCTVRLPEELFDMDCPGHYFRRIKNVALSIPCVTGPYTSVNCTLTLLKSSIRKTTSLGEGYARVGDDAERFSDYFGSLQSIVTSSGQNDSGLFETNLRDERYLPFEGSGVISEWQLQLPANPSKSEPCQFDYDTISDAILHIRYTAREAGGLLRNGAITNFKTGIEAAQAIGSVRLFSIRHEFPTEWAKFKNGDVTPLIELIITLKEEHYPFWSKGNVKTIKSVNLFVNSEQAVSVSWKADGSESQALAKDPSLGNLWAGKLANLPLTLKPISIMNEKFTLYFSDRSMDNMWLAIAWGKED